MEFELLCYIFASSTIEAIIDSVHKTVIRCFLDKIPKHKGTETRVVRFLFLQDIAGTVLSNICESSLETNVQ